jgi:dipeptidyl aminopeptidase/acylaminoacyl peptidase
MHAREPRPFGDWPSPITSGLAASASRRFGMVQTVGPTIYWTQSHPEQGGRQVIMRARNDGPGQGGREGAGEVSLERSLEELLPQPYSARSRVHEYGGGEFLVVDDTIYFVNDGDQAVYAMLAGGAPAPLTHAPNVRFADFAHDAHRARLVAVGEAHAAETLARNSLLAIALQDRRGEITELTADHDFFASPRLSPDGTRLAFLAWDLPDMPWDSATLFVADVGVDGRLGEPRRIAGGDGSFAFQPEWGPGGQLFFVWDQTGWGNLYAWTNGVVTPMHAPRAAELARAQWTFGARSYAVNGDAGRIGMAFVDQGRPLFVSLSLDGSRSEAVSTLPESVARIDDPVPFGDHFAALVSTAERPPAIMSITTNSAVALVASAALAARSPLPPAGEPTISRGRILQCPGCDGQTIFAVYYAPQNDVYCGPPGVAPPALVLAHGGPTSMADRGLKMRTQFYTSRGFAVLDVDYSGSTGYGRAYRRRLDGQWGIADPADCAAAARHLAVAGLADASRIAIAGGSAGGYTVLMALATSEAFAAGSCHYGVSDLRRLLEHTHKFESGYLYRLTGTTPSHWQDVLTQRSPLTLTDAIHAPLILFQGLDDKVVPPEQSRLMVAKLAQRGVEVAYHEFAGEGHGFRVAATIAAVLEAELAFLQRALRLG